MTQGILEPFFLESSAGRIFAVLHRAANSDRCVVFVPPFAQEMNKCRRQVTETAHLLAASGYSSLVVDLYGTGDSDGDFCDATWIGWQDDIACAFGWADENDLAVDTLVATRLGCALAAESLARGNLSVARSIFLQPVESGQEHISQFLRLGTAASMLQSEGRANVADLRRRLQNGHTLEIAGYPLSPALSAEIEQVQLSESIGEFNGDLRILEVGRSPEDELSAAGARVEAIARQHGIPTGSLRLSGVPYWASAELVVNSELCHSTVRNIVEGRQ